MTYLALMSILSSLIVAALACSPDHPGKDVCIDIFFTIAVVTGAIFARNHMKGKP